MFICHLHKLWNTRTQKCHFLAWTTLRSIKWCDYVSLPWSPITNSFLQDSLKVDNTQVERLGSDLQVQVKNLVVALREITKRERQQITERVREDCLKVKEDLSQTLGIQHYLASLLAETDPFLLVWVRLYLTENLLNITSVRFVEREVTWMYTMNVVKCHHQVRII